MASESTRLSAMMKRKRSNLPRGTPFRAFTCELDQGICIHKTPAGNLKIDCVVNKADLNLTCSSGKKIDFKCDVCFHIFSMVLKNVSKGSWCYMCSSSWKHCGKNGCAFCFKRSFASYTGVTATGKKKVDCIVNKVDLMLPLFSNKKVDFKCDVCLHIFSKKLNHVSNGQWCGMCSNTWKHCGNDGCTFCYKRSLASYTGVTATGKKKVDCIVDKADLLLPLCSRKKVDFVCDVCDYIFSISLYNVTYGSWCGKCQNKTELKVYNFLKELKVRVITQYTPGGIKKMRKNYGKFYKMDFYLPDLKLVFEIDGRQHNSHTHAFRSTTLHYRMILDQWKEYLVRKEGLVVVRFDQDAIWRDIYDWKKEMSMLCTSEFSTVLANKRYKMYAKKHMRGKFRIVPEIVKESYKKYGEPLSLKALSKKCLNGGRKDHF